MITYISDNDVQKNLPIKQCISELREAFISYGSGKSHSNSRDRIFSGNSILNTMPAYYEKYNIAGLKTYIASKNGVRFVVIIFDVSNPENLYVIDANTLGQIRTGALPAMVTSEIIKKKNINFALIGSGFQAETQLLSMKEVYDFENVYVYSRNYEHAKKFSEKFDFDITYSDNLSVLKKANVITSITNATDPIFDNSMLPDKYHLNLVGANILGHREASGNVLDNADIIITEHLEQSMKESSEISEVSDKNKIIELKDFILNPKKGNKTIFKTMGIGLEDIVSGYIVLKNMNIV